MGQPMITFTPTHVDAASTARLGEIKTPHGIVKTPNFIFCATKAAIKGLTMDAMKRAGAEIILSNTYHLMLQPGGELIEHMGGLNEFTRWQGPMLTDSGGYQVFSMAWGGISDEVKGRHGNKRPNTVLKINEEGVLFQSYLDGKKFLLTPESSMLLQRQLGADLIMAFDECTAFHHDHAYTAASVERTHRWALRSIEAFAKLNSDNKQAMYGIIQGAHYRDLREHAADFITQQDFFGLAVGGSFGQTKQSLYDILDWCAPYLRREGQPHRPVHLLGIGDIADIFVGVRRGIDTFDCVQPTRIGRHGWALMPFEAGGRINLRNARFRDDKTPLDPDGHNEATAHYTRGYIHHLMKAGEMPAIQILVEHNVSVMTRLMRELRVAIAAGTLDALEAKWLATQPENLRHKEFGDAGKAAL